MSRSDAESNFDDTLGNRVRWSLRRSVARSAPSAEVWGRIKQQAYAGESGARSRGTALRRVPGTLLDLGARTLRALDEYTVSSEVIWRPIEKSDACYRLLTARATSWPMFGQMLPMF